MILKEFLEAYNGAPYGMSKVAGIASKITDCPDLRNAAQAFVESEETLEEALEEIDFEFG